MIATVQIDLGTGKIRCLACGKGTGQGTFPSPCPFCGVDFLKVQYRRAAPALGRRKPRVALATTQTWGRTLFTLGDLELEKRMAVDWFWNRSAADIARRALGNAKHSELDLINALTIAKKAFYLERGISLTDADFAQKPLSPSTSEGGQAEGGQA